MELRLVLGRGGRVVVDAREHGERRANGVDAQLNAAGGGGRRPATGFSLVEVLVVIAVVAIVLGLSLPALERERGASRSAVCLVSLRTLGAGQAAWAADHKDLFPNMFTSDPGAAFVMWGGGSLSFPVSNSGQIDLWLPPLQEYAWHGSLDFLNVSGIFDAIACPEVRRIGPARDWRKDIDLNGYLAPLFSYRGAASMLTRADLWLDRVDEAHTEAEINARRKLVGFYEVTFPAAKGTLIERLAFHMPLRREADGEDGPRFNALSADGAVRSIERDRLLEALPTAVNDFTDWRREAPPPARRAAISGTFGGYTGRDFTP